MKKSVFYFGTAITMFCAASCSSDSAESRPIEIDDQTTQVSSDVNTDPQDSDAGEEKPKSRKQVEKIIDENIQNDPTTRSVNNTASIYRYLTSNPEYSVFSTLIKSSSIAKELHHDSFTMLAPLDTGWGAGDKKTALKWAKTGETEKINEYLRNHLIPIIVSAQKLQRTESLSSVGGMIMEFDQEKIEVNGVSFSTDDYSVGNGNVITLNGNLPL
jgi:uncharacterized surface protein with fasciclin (FAS1) repeats